MNEIQGKRILIAGMGREGKSVLGFLQKNFSGLEISVADKKDSGENYLNEISKYDTVIKSPGIPPDDIFKKAKHLTSLTNIFFENCIGTTIGVTGTKGKSTTSSLIAHILQSIKPDVRLIGNIGKPALDYLENSTKDTIFVVELSSYQLMDIHYSPHVAIILPIYEEHLNYHGNMENYINAKANITKHQIEKDYLIYYSKNDYCQKIANQSIAQKIEFNKLDVKSNLLGEANKVNIAAAFEVSKLFIKDEGKIKLTVQSFKPLPHRLESVGTYRGIEFVNDSLATIPEATIHALEALGEKVETLIAGGFDRGINLSKLGPTIADSSVKTLILFPDTGDKITKALMDADPSTKIKIFKTDDMKEAVRLAYKYTSKGKTCLLSPASTSFNLFKDYEERGNQFKKYAEELS